MVKSKGKNANIKNQSIKADIIVLGCSLPGIVTAHKLKTKFGKTMNIVVLDLVGAKAPTHKGKVVFQDQMSKATEEMTDYSAKQVLENVARYYLLKYSADLELKLPQPIIKPMLEKSTLQKVFQMEDGKTIDCTNGFHDFDYLSFIEKFELNQYHNYLNECMYDLFYTKRVNRDEETKILMYYDRTTMEKSLCGALLFNNSRQIMRMIVKLVCGVPAHKLSLLFYLHQCYRTSGARNHLDGDNTRFREKLLGHCRKLISIRLLSSIADITLSSKPISEIRTADDQQVILETMKGETTYMCSLLAMALRPDQLLNIQIKGELFSRETKEIIRRMVPGCAKKFRIQYEDRFWNKMGYSGDIFSMRGPILWAMEEPTHFVSSTTDKYFTLIGYMTVRQDAKDCKDGVIKQLVNIFGNAAADPVTYREFDIQEIFVPRCGDYVALRKLTTDGSPVFLEWGALDVFADGDVAAALEAGHTAYLNLLSCLRPQAMSYETVTTVQWPQFVAGTPVERWKAKVNVISGIWFSVYSTAFIITVRLLYSILKKR